MPDTDQALLQFIYVMNLVDPLLHFLHILQQSRFRSLLLGDPRYSEMNAGVYRSKVLIVSHARSAEVGELHCWKIKKRAIALTQLFSHKHVTVAISSLWWS